MVKKVGHIIDGVVDESLRITHYGEKRELIFESNGNREVFSYILNTVPTRMLSNQDWVDITIIQQRTGKEFHLTGSFPDILGCDLEEDPMSLARTVFRFAFDIIYQYYIEMKQNGNQNLIGPKIKKPMLVSDDVLSTIFGKR
ncbi:MAG: hypothetical protein WC483_04395 [Candidatus Paceibacterota bacterium]